MSCDARRSPERSSIMPTIRNSRLVTLIALSLLTMACAKADRPAPAVEVRVERVETPVSVRCISVAQWKALLAREPAKIATQLTGNASHDLDIVSASAIRLRAYAEGLQAALKACVG